MVDATEQDPLNEAAWVTLDDATIEELTPFGVVRAVEAGDILYRAGAPTPDFIVILEGEVEIVRPLDGGRRRARDARRGPIRRRAGSADRATGLSDRPRLA